MTNNSSEKDSQNSSSKFSSDIDAKTLQGASLFASNVMKDKKKDTK